MGNSNDTFLARITAETLEKPRIPALWFDAKGCGPDQMFLELYAFKALMDGETLVAPPHLGLRVRAGNLVIMGASLVDGGFYLGREQVEELHRQLGAWLSSDTSK